MASPPTTIGELADVPAPSSPVKSAWAQEISNRVLQRFASIAERDAKWPAATAGKGAHCCVTSNLGLFISDGAAWQPFGPMGLIAAHALNVSYSTTGVHSTAQDTGVTVTVNEPANRRWKWTMQSNPYGAAYPVLFQIMRNGVVFADYGVPASALNATTSHSLTFTAVKQTTAGAAVVYKVQMRNGEANVAMTDYASATQQRLLMIEDIGPA